MPIQRASRATIGTNMTSLQLYHAIKQDVLIPWNKNQPEEWKDGNELVVADRGGFIYEPEYGIHDHWRTRLHLTLPKDHVAEESQRRNRQMFMLPRLHPPRPRTRLHHMPTMDWNRSTLPRNSTHKTCHLQDTKERSQR